LARKDRARDRASRASGMKDTSEQAAKGASAFGGVTAYYVWRKSLWVLLLAYHEALPIFRSVARPRDENG